MKLEGIKRHLEKLRGKITELQKEEREWMEREKTAEDSEKLKIIRKSNISPEKLIFLNGINAKEIEMILEKRKEEKEIGKQMGTETKKED